ncbi:cytochrome P450 [Lentinula edodes]|nr:cytochrome P450 [Lentinula edodes]
MPPFLQVLASIFGTLGVYGLFLLAQYLYREATSPLNALPGPPNSSWIYGNSNEIQDAETSVTQEKWVEEYGTTFAYKWFLGKRLYTLDTVALNHILMSGYDYQKPEALRNWILKNVVGSGILVQEEDEHRRQRKVMNPAFGLAQIRELTEIFVDESLHLRDIWLSQVGLGADNGAVRVDVQSWLSRMTLDVIGRAGFNHRFNALDSTEPDELSKAFSVIFGISSRFTLWNDVLQGLFPLLRVFPSTSDSVKKEAQVTMERIGRDLLRQSKEHLAATGEKGDGWRARDLLSLLVRSNMSKDILEHQRMSDEDVISQVPTFLVAGHETTSTAVTWALYALTQDKEIQCKLREELLQVSTESPSMDILNSLPYLDAVVRETLRVYSPVTGTERVAMKDDILPLGVPFTDQNGEVHNDIRVRKGDLFNIPVLAVNRSKALWGEDARDFKPERWLTPGGVPSTVASIPGVWGNMLSFLGGAHACIGYRFSLVEMKALLFVLIRAFEFELAVSPEDIVGKASIVRRIHLKSEPEKGSQLPLWVKPYVQS